MTYVGIGDGATTGTLKVNAGSEGFNAVVHKPAPGSTNDAVFAAGAVNEAADLTQLATSSAQNNNTTANDLALLALYGE